MGVWSTWRRRSHLAWNTSRHLTWCIVIWRPEIVSLVTNTASRYPTSACVVVCTAPITTALKEKLFCQYGGWLGSRYYWWVEFGWMIWLIDSSQFWLWSSMTLDMVAKRKKGCWKDRWGMVALLQMSTKTINNNKIIPWEWTGRPVSVVVATHWL